MEYFNQRSKQLFITFIDFKKGCDCVHRETLQKMFRNYGLLPKLVSIIGLTLKNTESKVKFWGKIFKLFAIRQGDGLSTLLFNVAIDFIMKKWFIENPPKISIGQGGKSIKTNSLGFIDD